MQNHAKKWLNHTSANAMAAIAIGAMLVFSLAGMKAFADVVHTNTVEAAAQDVTVDVGDVVRIEYWITGAGGDGESGCNFGPSSGGGTATISLDFDSDVLSGPTSVEISDCGPAFKVEKSFEALAAGVATVTVSGVTDTSPGSGTYKADEDSDVTVTVNQDTDTTPPVNIQFVGISDGDRFDFGEPLPDVSCTAEDPESGVTSCTVSSLGTSVGSHTITATATNGVGLTAKKELTYEILAWDFNGFYSPVDNPTTVNTIKGGQTVPIKFEVFTTLSQEEKTSVDDIQSFQQKSVSCSTLASTTDAVEATTTGSTSLRYDESAGQFIATWKTPKEPNACYKIILTTDDGEAHEANFKLK